MPKDLKDQLKAWTQDNDAPLPSSKPLTPKQKRLAAVEAAAEKRRQERLEAEEREANLDDSDLFARAVEGIDNRSMALLNKYDATPGASGEGDAVTSDSRRQNGKPAGDKADDRPRVDPDAALFLDAVSDIPKHRQPRADSEDDR